MPQIDDLQKKIVITGGPCTGKTTTLQAIGKKGYPVIPEASTILIGQQIKSKGDVLPWIDLHRFNVKVTELQLELENLHKNENIIFLDRSLVDNLAYCKNGNISPPANLLDAVKKAKYNKIFFLEKLGKWEETEVRKDKEIADKIHQAIFEAYKEAGYNPVTVPPASVEERVEFIISRSQKISRQ